MKIHELWTNALRSGIYHQTRMTYPYLVEADGYTACGVLCSLALAHGIIEDMPIKTHQMPVTVQLWAKLQVPYIAPFSLDDDGRDFHQMANLIEDHSSKLFEE